MEILTSALLCMTLNIYNEARGEPIKGQYAVAQVTMNRVEDSRWGDSVCKVVYQPLQFSWTLQRFSIREGFMLDQAMEVAHTVLTEPDFPNAIWCADHYYNKHLVNPIWDNNMYFETEIGNHVFYCSQEAYENKIKK